MEKTTPKNIKELSPMMQQYLSIKAEHEKEILLFRLGDFYEMFFDDALLVSKELELTLTGRDCGQGERAPMCGVPHHSADAYIERLIKKGYKVAICEQTEDPKTAKGVVKREVVRVITPGTLVETNMLEESKNNFIASIYLSGKTYGFAAADISTGEIHVTEFEDDSSNTLKNELARFGPTEIVFNTTFLDKKEVAKFIAEKIASSTECLEDEFYEPKHAKKKVLDHFEKNDLADIGLLDKPCCVMALSGLFNYLARTQMTGISRLVSLNIYNDSQYIMLDSTARRNLEIIETLHLKEKRGSLLWVMDKTKTAMGKRLMRLYIEQPLKNAAVIEKRLNAVEELYNHPILRADIRGILSGIYDLERLMTKIVFGSCGPKDFKALEQAALQLPRLKNILEVAKSQYLCEIYNQMDPLEDVCELLSAALVDDPPTTTKDGWYIKEGFDPQVDEVRSLVTNTKDYLAEIEAREKEATGIKNLKIGYNKIFGYYIEVTRSYLELVPNTYIRKQTLANCERYITEELKTLEEKILSASENMLALESALFAKIRENIIFHLTRIQATANAVAKLDVFASLAQLAMDNNYCRPQMTLGDEINITEGRHPVVEILMNDTPFVANDLLLDNRQNQIAIITGPNMAGKSTYMRQSALIVLMAQIGSFVPASKAVIGVVDGIFTRVGASDDLSSGQSTFMMEMNEVASILKNATSKSILILDEIGRGTSTFDGMSIARAIIEYIADKNKLGAKTMFATHYHELTVLEESYSCIKNYNIAVKKRGEDITFLRKIVPGAADDSYGIEVSKLSGIPDSIVKRAFEILKAVENSETVAVQRKSAKKAPEPVEEQMQLSLDSHKYDLLKSELSGVNLDTLTPIEALNALYKLKNLSEQ